MISYYMGNTSLLNILLGSYITKPLSSKHLEIHVLNGNVHLTNLKINPLALDTFNLPIRIQDGTIGTFKLKVPWKGFKSMPVK